MDSLRLREFLEELVAEPSEIRKDILFYFDLPTFTGTQGVKGETNFGCHAVLMEGLTDNYHGVWGVRIVDPAVTAPKQYTVEGSKLLTGMQKLGDDLMGGIWLISSGEHSAAEDHSAARLKAYDETPALPLPQRQDSVDSIAQRQTLSRSGSWSHDILRSSSQWSRSASQPDGVLPC